MNEQLLKGIGAGVLIQLIALVALAFYYQGGVGVVEYLQNAIQYKSILKLGVFASIPNVVLFFLLINQNKVQFAKGIQYVLIVFVLFLIVVKLL